MTGSLMAALHTARTLITEGAHAHRPTRVACEHGDGCACAFLDGDVSGDPLAEWIVAEYQSRPDQVSALYDAAGMIGPGGQAARVPSRIEDYRQPHAKAVTQRVMAALREGPQTSNELCVRLGARRGTVQTSINRLRERGAKIEGVSHGGSNAYRYTLRSA